MTEPQHQFALIGAAGYIAPRHLKAIAETRNNLAAAFDVNDSVGVIDGFFPEAAFFTEFERFADHIHDLRQSGSPVKHVAICSPNHLHRAHIAFALRSGCHAICEKPLLLHPDEFAPLAELERASGRRVNSILQLRLHPSIIALRDAVRAAPKDRIYDVDLGYFTSRGAWYHASWKGDAQKSGGIAANIGVHFFDMLGFVFGPLQTSVVHHKSADASAGYLEFAQARVRWVLSINRAHLPAGTPQGQTTHRSITVDGDQIEFSAGFTDLHTESYRQILAGEGYGLDDARPSIALVHQIGAAAVDPSSGAQHPDLAKVIGG